MRDKTAFVTGHRYVKYNHKLKRAINLLIDKALELETNKFLVGMARGSDLLFAEILSERKLNWTAIIPCKDQTLLWNDDDINRYQDVLKQANNSIILYQKYSKGVMQGRNNYMVKNSDLCLSIYDNSPKGGTALTVNLAIKNHLPIYQFNPKINTFHSIKSQQLSLF